MGGRLLPPLPAPWHPLPCPWLGRGQGTRLPGQGHSPPWGFGVLSGTGWVVLAGGCNLGHAHACARTDGCPLSPAPTPAALVGLHLHTPPIAVHTQPARACNHPRSLHARAIAHTHAPARAPLPAQRGDAPSAPCLSPPIRCGVLCSMPTGPPTAGCNRARGCWGGWGSP